MFTRSRKGTYDTSPQSEYDNKVARAAAGAMSHAVVGNNIQYSMKQPTHFANNSRRSSLQDVSLRANSLQEKSAKRKSSIARSNTLVQNNGSNADQSPSDAFREFGGARASGIHYNLKNLPKKKGYDSRSNSMVKSGNVQKYIPGPNGLITVEVPADTSRANSYTSQNDPSRRRSLTGNRQKRSSMVSSQSLNNSLNRAGHTDSPLRNKVPSKTPIYESSVKSKLKPVRKVENTAKSVLVAEPEPTSSPRSERHSSGSEFSNLVNNVTLDPLAVSNEFPTTEYHSTDVVAVPDEEDHLDELEHMRDELVDKDVDYENDLNTVAQYSNQLEDLVEEEEDNEEGENQGKYDSKGEAANEKVLEPVTDDLENASLTNHHIPGALIEKNVDEKINQKAIQPIINEESDTPTIPETIKSDSDTYEPLSTTSSHQLGTFPVNDITNKASATSAISTKRSLSSVVEADVSETINNESLDTLNNEEFFDTSQDVVLSIPEAQVINSEQKFVTKNGLEPINEKIQTEEGESLIPKEQQLPISEAQIEGELQEINGGSKELKASLQKKAELGSVEASDKTLDEANGLQITVTNASSSGSDRLKNEVDRQVGEMDNMIEKALEMENDMITAKGAGENPLSDSHSQLKMTLTKSSEHSKVSAASTEGIESMLKNHPTTPLKAALKSALKATPRESKLTRSRTGSLYSENGNFVANEAYISLATSENTRLNAQTYSTAPAKSLKSSPSGKRGPKRSPSHKQNLTESSSNMPKSGLKERSRSRQDMNNSLSKAAGNGDNKKQLAIDATISAPPVRSRNRPVSPIVANKKDRETSKRITHANRYSIMKSKPDVNSLGLNPLEKKSSFEKNRSDEAHLGFKNFSLRMGSEAPQMNGRATEGGHMQEPKSSGPGVVSGFKSRFQDSDSEDENLFNGSGPSDTTLPSSNASQGVKTSGHKLTSVREEPAKSNGFSKIKTNGLQTLIKKDKPSNPTNSGNKTNGNSFGKKLKKLFGRKKAA